MLRTLVTSAEEPQGLEGKPDMTSVPWDGKFEDVLRATLPGMEPMTALAPDTPLKEVGLDSMSVMQIIASLEETYCVSLAPEALVPATFETPVTVWEALRGALDAVWDDKVRSSLIGI